MRFSLFVNGVNGRMGKAITALAQQDFSFALQEELEQADVAVDFSVPEALSSLLQRCIEHRKPLVIGTTGHSSEAVQAWEEAAQKIPVLASPNFSLGLAVSLEAVERMGELIGNLCDIEIVEAHHRTKKDLPSGTAMALARATGRPQAPIHALRAGDIIGDHTVHFVLAGERIELRHLVQSREAFARGALLAAKFLKSRPPGLYTLKDMLHAARQS